MPQPKYGIRDVAMWLEFRRVLFRSRAFNPFTFKVITNKYDPVAIYFIVLGSSLYTIFVRYFKK